MYLSLVWPLLAIAELLLSAHIMMLLLRSQILNQFPPTA